MTAAQSGWRFADGITPAPWRSDVEDDRPAPTESDQLLTTEASA